MWQQIYSRQLQYQFPPVLNKYRPAFLNEVDNNHLHWLRYDNGAFSKSN